MANHILVVDDHPINLKLVSELLEYEGYTIDRAPDAESAIEIIKRRPPDLILMDIALPGMDGFTLTRMLKENDETKNIIIIALTSFAMKGDELKAIEAGCDDYVSKPIDTRTLPVRIKELLQKRIR